MDPNRKRWNEQEQELQRALARPEDHPEAIDLFLRQHAMLHAAEMAHSGLHSFADEVLDGLSEADYRRIPPKGEHSIAWILWHLTRIEDVTMNLLVAGSSQLFNVENWPKKLNVTVRETGNALDETGIADLSAAVDLDALLAYRLAVGRRTRQIVQQLQPGDFKRKVDPAHLEQIMAEGAVEPAARGLIEYWGKRTIAGLLLMPPTRHNFIHLNEIARLRTKLHS
jgi:hypothetical protein